MVRNLAHLHLEAEVKAILDSIKSEKAPDEMTSTFFKKYWNLIKEDIMNFIEGIFNGKEIVEFVN